MMRLYQIKRTKKGDEIMKIKPGFIIRKLADNYVVVPVKMSFKG